MALDKEIAEQIKLVEGLQKDLIQIGATTKDVTRPAALTKQRAADIRAAISRLETEKTTVAARYDTEIKALEVELKALDQRSDLDLVNPQGGGARTKAATRKPAKAKTSNPPNDKA